MSIENKELNRICNSNNILNNSLLTCISNNKWVLRICRIFTIKIHQCNSNSLWVLKYSSSNLFHKLIRHFNLSKKFIHSNLLYNNYNNNNRFNNNSNNSHNFLLIFQYNKCLCNNSRHLQLSPLYFLLHKYKILNFNQ